MSDGHLFLYIDHAVLFIAFTVLCALLLQFARPSQRRWRTRGETELPVADSTRGATRAMSPPP